MHDRPSPSVVPSRSETESDEVAAPMNLPRRPPLIAIAALFLGAALVGAGWRPIEKGDRGRRSAPVRWPRRADRGIHGRAVADTRSGSRSRGLRLRPVLGDGRGDRPPRRGTRLTTLALFSVTHGDDGGLVTSANGYRKITGPVGRRLATDARERGVRVELVYTSFGYRKNDAFFASPTMQERTIEELVALADELKLDGVNVDVEQLEPHNIAAYGQFIGRLRAALVDARPDAQVSVATTSGPRGATMAVAATAAGAERVFIMGYDYHWSGSQPGASAPLDRRDGEEKDLVWTLDVYEAAGVPVERTILGLPLYGMSGRSAAPSRERCARARAGHGSRAGTSTSWPRRRSRPGVRPARRGRGDHPVATARGGGRSTSIRRPA